MTVYTNNVPQKNQTIAQTTDPIRNNFAFLDDAIDQEHNFDITDPTKTYHKQAAMPDIGSAPVAVPAGTNGMYYVIGSEARFLDDAPIDWKLNIWTTQLKGSVTSPSNSSNFTISAIPANVFGVVYFYRTSIPYAVFSGQFASDSTTVHGFNNRVLINGSSTDNPIELQNNPGTNLALRGSCASSTFQNKSYNYLILYKPA